MADIVNLRRARKAMEHARRMQAAAEARMRPGRTLAEKKLASEESHQAAEHLDGHRLRGPSSGEDH
jgi:hypothetical protein